MDDMFDFHTHTVLSDGRLLLTESMRLAQLAGYRMLGIADHSDLASMEHQLAMTIAAARAENRNPDGVRAYPGTEITLVRPRQIAEAVDLARSLGAAFVIVHGETIVEQVEPGTNLAAIEAGADILAHPGLVTPDEVRLAAERGVMLEISGRRGNAFSNGHVAKLALEYGAPLVFGSDAHAAGEMPTREFAERICLSAALPPGEVAAMFARAERFGNGLKLYR